MTALELISTMDAQRTSWRLSADRFLSRRQLLFIADVLRARLLTDRRERDPVGFENSAQTLPLLTPKKSTTTFFGVGVPVFQVGPVPRPLEARSGPGFTFVGVPGQRKLQVIGVDDVHLRKYSRHSADKPCALWLPDTRELIFNEQKAVLPLTEKRRIRAVFLHPMEAAHYVEPGTQPKLLADPLGFEYPLPGNLIQILLEMAAKHEQLTTLLPADIENDDNPATRP
jgi:hypothetical protein